MAEIYLTSRELGDQSLPSLCVVCGRKGRATRVSLVEEVNPVMSMFTKVSRYRMRDAFLPLCASHAKYFGRFYWFGLILAVILFGSVGTLILGGAVFGIRHPLFFFGGMCIFMSAGFGGSLGYLIYKMTMKVRPKDMTRKGVLMVNIAEAFADAVEEQRDDQERGRRRRRSRRRDEDEEEDD